MCDYCYKLNKSPLILTLGSFTFEIPFSELWITSGSICYLATYLTSRSEWILGDVFIRNYYFVINYDQGAIQVYGDNIKKADTSLSPWVIFLIVTASLIVVAVFIYFLCCRGRKHSSSSHSIPSSSRERLLHQEPLWQIPIKYPQNWKILLNLKMCTSPLKAIQLGIGVASALNLLLGCSIVSIAWTYNVLPPSISIPSSHIAIVL